MASIKTGAGRAEFVQWLGARRAARLFDTANDYEKMPDNIRAAVARVAGVADLRLDELTPEDRRKLFKACGQLREKLDRAFLLLMRANTTPE